MQIAYLMLFYSVAVFWGTYFPFNYREAKAIGKIKYIFSITMAVSFSFPLLSLVLLKDGYFTSNFLSNSCTPQNPTHHYIVFTFQLSVLLWFLVSTLILIIWKIFKVKLNLQQCSQKR